MKRWPLLVALAAASAPAAARQLTVEEAVAAVLARHPDLAAAEAGARQAAAARSEAAAALWPQVSLGAGYNYLDPVPEIAFDPGIPGIEPVRKELGAADNARITGWAGWRAFDAGRRRLAVAAAGARAAAAESEIESARTRLALEVRLLACSYLLAGAAEQVALDSLAGAEEHARQAGARAAAGTGTELEASRAAVRVAELGAQRVQAAENRRRVSAELAVLLGSPAAETIEVQGSLAALADRPLPAGDPVESNAGVRALRAAAEGAQLAARAQQRSLYPTLDLAGSVAEEYPHLFEKEWGESYQIGFQIQHSLYAGGARRSRIRLAQAAADELAARLAAIEDQLRRQAVQARAQHVQAQAELGAARERRVQAERYLTAARTSVEAGLATDLDLRDAELALDSARLSITQAEYAAGAARALWLALLGAAGEAAP